MKRLFILTLAMVLMASMTWAETHEKIIYQFVTPSETKEVKKEVTRKIEVVKEKEFLTITIYPKDSKPVICRVWPCGLIERQEWKEISGNKEYNSVLTGSTNWIDDRNFIYLPSTNAITR